MPGPREIEGVYFKVRADVKEAMDDLARLNQAKAQAGTPVGGGGGGGSSGGGWGASGATPPNWGASGGAVSFGFGHGSAVGVGNALGGGIGPVWGTGPFGGGGTPFQSQFGASMQAINNQWLATQGRQASVGASILGMEQRAFAMQGESIRSGAQSANDQWLADNSRRASVSNSILGMEQEGYQSQFRSQGADYYRRQSVGNEIMRMEGVDAGVRQQNDYYARQGQQYQADADEDAMNERLMSQQGGLFGRGGLFGTGVGRKGTGFGKYIALHAAIGGLSAAGQLALNSRAEGRDISAAASPEDRAAAAMQHAGDREKALSSIPWIGGLAATGLGLADTFVRGYNGADIQRNEALATSGQGIQAEINIQRRQLKLETAGSFDSGSQLSNQLRELRSQHNEIVSSAEDPFNRAIATLQAQQRNSVNETIGAFSHKGPLEAVAYQGANFAMGIGKQLGISSYGSMEEYAQSKITTTSGQRALEGQRDSARISADANASRRESLISGQIDINTQHMGDVVNRGSITAEYNKALREATNALKNAGDADKIRVAEETNYTRIMAQRTRDSGMIGVASEANSIMGGARIRSLEASGQGIASERASAALSVDSAKYAFAQALISKDPEKLRVAGSLLGAAMQDQSSADTSIARRTSINSTNIWGQISASEARLFGGGDYQAQRAGISVAHDQMMEQRGNTGLTSASINRLTDLQYREADKGRAISMAGLSVQNSYLESQLKAAQQFGHRDFSGAATTTAIGQLTEQANAAMVGISAQADPILRNKARDNAVAGLNVARENAKNQLRSGYAEVEDVYETRASGFRGPQNAMPDTGELVKAITNLIAAINTVAARTPGMGDGSGIFFGNGN